MLVATPDPLPIGQLLRISADRTGLGLGVERQSQDNHVLADARGWNIIETFSDNDRSAYRGRFGPDGRWISGRPEYDRCLQWLRDGRIKGLVAWHPDRIFGHPRELEDLIDLIDKTGVQIATVQTGSYDLSTASGRLIARTIAAASRYEREIKAARHKSQHLQLAKAGKPAGGGIRPYGFELDQATIRPDEAEIIQEMARRLLAGESVRSVAADLNSRGVPTVTGAQWAQANIRQIVTAARVAGLRSHLGEVVGDAVWPAIIERASWEALCRHFADPARRTKRSARSYLLNGIALCGRDGCGAKLVSRPTELKKRAYACVKGPGFSGCGKLRIMADPLERFVVAGLLHRLDGGGLDRALADQTDEAETAETTFGLIEVEQRLEDLAAMYGAGEINRREWMKARSRLDAHRAELALALAGQRRTSALSHLAGPGGTHERWEQMSFDQQHAALREAVQVRILPAIVGRNYFDPDRVDPDWFI
jgi:site-specific DNA recombinase